jgi:hypothetical protein
MLKPHLRLALLCAFTPAFCQQPANLPEPSTYTGEPSSELLEQWLHSGDPRLVAWSSHDILIGHYAELLPAVQSTLELELSPRYRKAFAADEGQRKSTVALLDTIIQMNGQLTPSTLTSLDRSFDAQKLILLSRLSWDDAMPIWQALYQPSQPDQRQATRIAAETLARNPPPGFAAALLKTIIVTASIFVHDPGSGFGIGMGSSCGIGCGIMRATSDWPEVGSYAFHEPPKPTQPEKVAPIPPNWTLFIDGPDPIYFVRDVNRQYEPATCGGGIRGLDDALRSHITGTLLGGAPASPFPESTVQVDIEFYDREAYRAKVAAFVEAQQQNFSRVAEALTYQGKMTEEERQASALPINLMLRDFRSQPREDLPPIAFRPPVQWVRPY